MKDIYQVEPNFNWPKPTLYLVKGTVKNGTNGVEAEIKVEITSKNNKVYKTIKSNSKTGDYLVSLPPGVSYQLTYTYKNLPEQRLAVNTVDLNGYMEKINDVNFEEKVDVLAANTASLHTNKKGEPELKAGKTQTLEAVATTKNSSVGKTSETLAVADNTAKESAIAKNTEKPVETAKEQPVIIPEEVINHVKTEPKVETTVAAVAKKEEPAAPVSEPVAVVEKIKPAKEPVTPVSNKNEDLAIAIPPTLTPTGSSNKSANTPGAVWDFTTNPVTSTPLNLPKTTVKETSKEPAKDFVPVNGPQAKAIKFTEKYSEVTASEMEFRVQVAAVKNDKNVVLPNQKLLGKVEKLNLNDGFTRITVGGSFKTLGEAMEHNKKVVRAGQKEGFIIALYKGKRVSLDELEKMGLLK